MKYDFDQVVDRRNTNSYKWNVKENELPMWVADMDFPAAPEIRKALQERLDHGVFGYADLPEEWYDAYINWWGRRHGFTIEKDWLLFSTGVLPSLSSIVRKLTTPAENVLVMTPVYNHFFSSILNNGRNALESLLVYEDGAYHIDFADLEAKLADPQTSMMILCNPQDPAGIIWDRATLARIGELCTKHGVLVVSDEIHCDLLRLDQKHIPLGKVMPDYKKLVTCMAPSKTFNLAGLMISNVMIRDEGLKNIWLSKHYNFDNPLSIAAAQAAYEGGDAWLQELRAYLDGNFEFTQEYLKEHLPKATFRISEATYLAWVDLSKYFEPDEVLPLFFAYKAGVLLEGGNMFVQHSDGFIRLNLACPRATLEEGLKRICEAVNTKHTEKYYGEEK